MISSMTNHLIYRTLRPCKHPNCDLIRHEAPVPQSVWDYQIPASRK